MSELRVKLTKEGLQEYYGTASCTGSIQAYRYNGIVCIRGEYLLEAGADEKLISHTGLYLFEENEVEVVK